MVTLPEDAAQLLYIVDYIADWARDVYRKNVLHCLSDESSISRLWLSRDSMETQVSHVLLNARNRSSTADEDRGDGQYTGHQERTTQDSASQPFAVNDLHTRTSSTPGSLFGRANTQSVFDHADTQPGSPFRGSTPKTNDATLDSPSIIPVWEEWWKQIFQIERPKRDICVSRRQHGQPALLSLDHSHKVSHLNLELDRFCHIRIPEDDSHLDLFIDHCKIERMHFCFYGYPLDTHGGLLSLLRHALIWDVESLNMLQQLWTNSNSPIPLNKSSTFATCVLYHCYLDETYGHVVREIVCLTASELALKKVFSKAGKPLDFYPLRSVSVGPHELVRALQGAAYNDLVHQLLRPDLYYLAMPLRGLGQWAVLRWTHMVLLSIRGKLPEWHHPSTGTSEQLVTFDIRPWISWPSRYLHDVQARRVLASSVTVPGALFIKLRGPKFCILVFGPDPSDICDHKVISQVVKQLKSTKIVLAEGHSDSGHRELIARPMDSDDINELDKIADLIGNPGAANRVYQAHQGTSVAIHPARRTGTPEV